HIQCQRRVEGPLRGAVLGRRPGRVLDLAARGTAGARLPGPAPQGPGQPAVRRQSHPRLLTTIPGAGSPAPHRPPTPISSATNTGNIIMPSLKLADCFV